MRLTQPSSQVQLPHVLIIQPLVPVFSQLPRLNFYLPPSPRSCLLISTVYPLILFSSVFPLPVLILWLGLFCLHFSFSYLFYLWKFLPQLSVGAQVKCVQENTWLVSVSFSLIKWILFLSQTQMKTIK